VRWMRTAGFISRNSPGQRFSARRLALAAVFAAAGLLPAPCRAGTLTLYDEGLAAGWADWSWGSEIQFCNLDPVHEGEVSLAVTYLSPWAGLYLHTESAVSTGDCDRMTFWVHGGTAGGQALRVMFNNDPGQAVTLPPLVAGTWQRIELPLDMVPPPCRIGDVAWQETAGSAQGAYYLDQIAFEGPQGDRPLSLTVDARRRHAISPHVYGINFGDESLAAALNVPLRRYGGNATTRYNWRNDTANRAGDWYFENIPNPNGRPEDLPAGSETDRFVEQDRRTGASTILTVPLIGWTPRERAFACGFRVSRYGAQQSVDPWQPDCGNGVAPAEAAVSGNDPQDTSLPIDEAFVGGWVRHLVGRFGPAAAGGVSFYALDNEPMLWNHTHRDVHPEPVSYDEIRDLTYRYASAVKAEDPSARVLGPAVWGWTAYFWSALDVAPGAWGQDRSAHGGTAFLPWYLQQMQAHEQQHRQRILDFLDIHYYPQAPGVALGGQVDAATQALRLRSTRSLWDPSYHDESWIGEPVRLIPRMKEWIRDGYPGTKLAITEYNWGAPQHINGALAQADVLGIFGREGVDLATLWAPGSAEDPWAFAFRMYRDYDGRGGEFGSIGVSAASTDPDRLAVFAALTADRRLLTVLVINKTAGDLRCELALAGTRPAGNARVYRYSEADLHAIVREEDRAAGPGPLEATYQASSITLLAVPVVMPVPASLPGAATLLLP